MSSVNFFCSFLIKFEVNFDDDDAEHFPYPFQIKSLVDKVSLFRNKAFIVAAFIVATFIWLLAFVWNLVVNYCYSAD